MGVIYRAESKLCWFFLFFLSQPETLIIDDVLKLAVLVSVKMIKLHEDGPPSDTVRTVEGRKMEACKVESKEARFFL